MNTQNEQWGWSIVAPLVGTAALTGVLLYTFGAPVWLAYIVPLVGILGVAAKHGQ